MLRVKRQRLLKMFIMVIGLIALFFFRVHGFQESLARAELSAVNRIDPESSPTPEESPTPEPTPEETPAVEDYPEEDEEYPTDDTYYY